MKRKKSSASPKLSPLSTPTAKPLTKKELDNLKEIRRYGVKDLKKYLKKIKKNVEVFQEAIAKEKKEMKRIRNMIKVLENDIKTFNALKKKLK